MASISKKQTKTGKTFYEIRCHIDRNRPTLTKRWYPPEGWSKRAIDKELNRQAAEFERQCKEGMVLGKAEKAEKAAQEAAEAAKILTLQQYAEQVFLPAKKIGCSGNTIASFKCNLKNHIYPTLGEQKMPDITAAQISAVLLGLQSKGKSHATAVKVYTVLQSLFKMAYRNDMIDRNPMDKVERPKPRKDEVKKDGVEAYSIDELCYIMECLNKEPLKWRVLIRLLIDTGIRRGECCGLKWENIDFQRNTITIAGNLSYTPELGVYLDTTKNSHVRTIDVDPDVIALLAELRKEQAASCISEWVFTQDNSPAPMHPNSPTRRLKKLSDRYGIPDFHPHKLRHSFASVAITNGADVASISEKLGHMDKAVTLRMYTHANEDSMRQASQVFRNALRKKESPGNSEANEKAVAGAPKGRECPVEGRGV